jgi:WD40 repeat protein
LRHDARVVHVAFSADGRWLATGTESGQVRVWNVAEGLPVTPPLLHDAHISKVLFLADGRSVLTASWDGTARVHDLPIIDGRAPAWLPEYLERRMRDDSLPSLRAALRLSPTNQAVLAKWRALSNSY